jgi:hypothetical protein
VSGRTAGSDILLAGSPKQNQGVQVPEPAKTRQPRQRTTPAKASEPTPDAESTSAVQEPLVTEDAVVDDVAAEVAEAPETVEAAAEEPTDEVESEPVRTKAVKPTPVPVKSPSKRQVERELKVAEKHRLAAEQQRRKADFKAAQLRQTEADRVQLWADRRQADADKARANAEKAAAKAEAVRAAAGEEPTGAAARRVAAAERWEVYTQDKLDRTQSDADALRKRARKIGVHSTKASGKVANPGSRQWVPPTFITVGLLGVIWLVVYYITASTSIYVPGMSDLGGWNVVIGMGLMASAFGIATLWK